MSSDTLKLNPFEKRTAISLSLVFALRMLGLFMIMPIFAIYGQSLIGYSPLWVGLAIGAYGLTQAALQIPAGMLSDKVGRRPVIYGGLVLFAIGSLVAAFSDSVYGVTIGRALQGTGAIASAILALAADVTREQQRPKVMGMIGVSIGLAFAIAMMAGPILAPFIGLQGLFLITAAGAILGIIIVHTTIPNVVNKAPKSDTVANPSMMLNLAKHPQLLRLNTGIFILHLTLSAIFVILPLSLQSMHFNAEQHWKIYFPALLISFVLIIPMLISAAKKQRNKHFYLASILLMSLSLIIMSVLQQSIILMFFAILLFFTAFNFLEASLPAFVSMLTPAGSKGTAMGIYSTHQFLGAFFGGIVGGLSYKLVGSSGLFLSLAGIMIIWFLLSLGMNNPSKIKTFTFTTKIKNQQHSDTIISQLVALKGALEVVVIAEEQIVYIKANTLTFQQHEAKHILDDS